MVAASLRAVPDAQELDQRTDQVSLIRIERVEGTAAPNVLADQVDLQVPVELCDVAKLSA